MAEITPTWLADRLKKEGQKVREYFGALSDDKWELKVYNEGETWTIRNVLAHLVTAERGLFKLFKLVREGGMGVSDEFSVDRYNARQQEKSAGIPTAELLEQFGEVRNELAEWVSNLSQEDLKIEGRHPFLGQVQLVEMIKLIYRHNQIHIRDIPKLVD
ncbi:MAG: DinB family protein [Anaerolineae bacterium]|nr:DinB family protein [Anaerolineae bacterium]